MKRKYLLFAIALIAMCQPAKVQAQEDSKSGGTPVILQVKDFTLKPVAVGMMSVYGDFQKGSQPKYGFNLDRSYIGLEATLGKEWLVKFVTDIGKSSAVDDYQRIVYIKNAFVQWNHKAVSLRAGLISTNVLSTQEKFWGRRYVLRSFQDEYKFAPTADLGIGFEWRMSKVVSLDVIIVNGEGYKKVQIERGFLYGLGLTVKPVSGLTLRVYGDLNQRPDDGRPQKTLNAMAGYKNKAFSIAAEGNFSFTQNNNDDQNLSGLSVYGSAKAGKCDVFARYDMLTSKNDWNKAKDGNMVLLGVEIPIIKYIKIAPNAKVWLPSDDKKPTFSANVNLQFSL
ncbi:MAG: hypothetical protein HUK08_09540 [Bacteroidaceae bacterium]|nr:hypothetical protein [Bacteroidaceae bacterium]